MANPMREPTLTQSERRALLEAVYTPGGWVRYDRETTPALAERGFVAEARHRFYGMQWCITDAGRKAANAE